MPTGSLKSLVNHLVEAGVLKTPVIIDAFKNIDRQKFVPEDAKQWAYIDEALPIPGGQTVSQPYTVAFMLELLEPKPGEKIIDIGAGSGWQTSLLAHIASFGGADGKVFAVEIAPELCRFGEKNITKYNFIEKGVVKWFCGDASKEETFESAKDEISGGVDKIVAAAALDGDIPQEWKNWLKVGGRMVVPIKESIWLLVKKDEKNFEETEHSGFIFVPFINGNNK